MSDPPPTTSSSKRPNNNAEGSTASTLSVCTSCFFPAEQTLSPSSVKSTNSILVAESAASDTDPGAQYSMESLLLVVTGASKGLGKAIVEAFCLANLVQVEQLHVLLVARSSQRLEEMGRQILQHHEQTNVRVQLTCHTADLSHLEQLDHHFDRLFQAVDVSQFERVIFVNNAGSLGFLGPCTESPSVLDMKASVDLNVTSALWLSSRFAKLIQSSHHKNTTLVNISSLLAIQSFPTMGIYGAGKAARDHFHVTLAKENPNLKVLNYAPGPLETDMVTEIRQAPKLDATLRPAFDPPLIEPLDSAKRLVQLLLQNSFESGQHVDYYDLDKTKES